MHLVVYYDDKEDPSYAVLQYLWARHFEPILNVRGHTWADLDWDDDLDDDGHRPDAALLLGSGAWLEGLRLELGDPPVFGVRPSDYPAGEEFHVASSSGLRPSAQLPQPDVVSGPRNRRNRRGRWEESRLNLSERTRREAEVAADFDLRLGVTASAAEWHRTKSELGARIEVFVALWRDTRDQLPLDPEDRRLGDALANLADEAYRVSDPPRSVLRETFHWFAQKLDVMADAAVKTIGVGVGGLVTFELTKIPALRDAAQAVLEQLGRS